MKIEQLRLHNICQHTDLTLDFAPGLTGLLGANGAGKTNILKFLEFLITGKMPGIRSIDDHVTWGERSGSASLTLSTRAGVQCSVERHIGENASAEFIFDGKVVDTLSTGYAALHGIMDATPAMLSSVAFLRQGEIDKFLFSGAAARSTAFQKLFKTGKAESGRSLLHEEITSVQVNDHIQDVETSRRSIEEYRERSTELGLQITELSAELDVLNTDVKTALALGEGEKHRRAVLESVVSRLSKQEAQLDAVMAKHAASLQVANPGDSDFLEYTEQLKLHIIHLRRSLTQVQMLKLASKADVAEDDTPCPICGDVPNVVAGKCPLCGSNLPEHHHFVEFDSTKATTEIRSAEATVASIRSSIEQLSTVSAELTEAKKELDAVDNDLITMYNKIKQQQDELASKLANLRGQKSQLDRTITNETSRLNSLVALTKTEAERTRYIAGLTETRRILHRENLPNLVARSQIGKINKEMQKFLDIFDTDFDAYLDESLAPLVTFPGTASAQPAEEVLSGGQKTALAISFSVALWSLFLPNVSFMGADELTHNLDAERTENLVALMRVLSSYCMESQAQVIIVTHSQELIPGFDTVVEIG